MIGYTVPAMLSHICSPRTVAMLACGVACLFLTGCVRRTITISSEPDGALCWLNGREIGRTPLSVDFTYYGDYDVVLQKDGYEPLLTKGEAKAPIWDTVPFDFVAEVIPGERQSNFKWHYDLQPRNDDPAGLLERAQDLRQQVPPVEAPTTAPETAPAEPSPVPAEPSAPARR
jgi:hypothetical protein